MTKLAQQFAFALVAFLATSSASMAEIQWEYSSTDGIDTMAGFLTTDGNLPLVTNGIYQLISIDSVALNAPPVLGSVDIYVSNPFGELQFDGTTTSIWSIDDFLTALPHQDLVDLGDVGYATIARVGAFTETEEVNSSGVQIFGFEPIANTFNPVPEPSTLVLAALGVLGLLGFGRRRRSS